MGEAGSKKRKQKKPEAEPAHHRYKDKEYQEAIGRSFERHRTKKGYSIDRVHLEAEKLSRATISHVDRGMVDAQLSTLRRYADTISVPLWQIIRDAVEPGQQ